MFLPKTKLLGYSTQIDKTLFPTHLIHFPVLNGFTEFWIKRRKYYLYLTAKPIGHVIHVVKLRLSFPLLDIYELRIGDVKGVSIGYLLYTPSKHVKYCNSFIMAKTGVFDETYTLKDLLKRDTRLKLKHSLPNIRLYSYGAGCALIISAKDSPLKHRLEF